MSADASIPPDQAAADGAAAVVARPAEKSARGRLSGAGAAIAARAPRGLSAKLLAVAVVAVLVVEAFVFLPSASNYRTAWLGERIERAYTAALAVAAAPDFESSGRIAQEIMATAEVTAIALRRDGQRQLILDGPPPPGALTVVDLDAGGTFSRIPASLMDFFAADTQSLLVTDMPRRDDGVIVEIVVPAAPLREALHDFAGRILVLSLLISIATGALLYAALDRVFVRPMQALAAGMVRFRADPRDPARTFTPSGREDEIGVAERELATLQTEVRAALAQRERLAALGEAVAKINHDLRNVLTSAQLVSDRLASNPDPAVRQQGERLVRSIDRGVRLAQGVLDYGRAPERPPERSRFPLRPVLEEAFADAVGLAKGPIGFDLAVDSALEVSGDPEHAHRIFLNLMRNAVQALDAQTGRPHPGMLTVRADVRPNCIRVVVSDDGPGLPERARARLFQAFSASSRPGGSGLGLAIARELARAMGGEVDLLESGEAGAAFAVDLPVGDGPASGCDAS